MARERECRLLVVVAADIHRATGQPAGIQRLQQSRLVDQVAARSIHEKRACFHLRERVDIHQVLGFFGGNRETGDEIRLRQQLRQFDLHQSGIRNLCVGIVDQHTHAQRHAQITQVTPDLPVADHAERCPIQLTAHEGVRHSARMVVGG